jgi:phosphatidylinositol alpha-1,6-mannosyltransferase
MNQRENQQREKAMCRFNAESRSRPRLMFVLGLAPQKIGGIEKFLRYFVESLDRAGWDSVLCFDGAIAQEFQEYISNPCVVIESLDNQGRLGFGCSSQLWKLLRKYKPQTFVYAFNGILRCFPWMAKLAGCRQVFFNDHSSRSHGEVVPISNIVRKVISRIIISPLTSIISVSDFTRRSGGSALGITSVPNIVVPNGVEVREFSPIRGAEFRAMYEIAQSEFVITQVCWMVQAKGVETMILAAAMFLQKHSGARFIFVGEGSELLRYKELVSELGIGHAVVFTGMIKVPTESGLFDATDVYCQPSIWQEASGLAVLEAMSVKVPVIASNTGGLPENVRHDHSGILVPVGDSAQICAALERLLGNAELRKSMGEAGHQLILKEHRIEDTVRRYVEIFTGNS